MTLAQQPTQPIEAYLADLRTQLAPLPLAEREEILREISAHIRDSVETGAPVHTVLAGLGTPAQLAAEYRDGELIRAASRSLSPIKLLRATLRLATKGVTGIVVFFAAIFGYAFGVGLFLTGILKAIFPAYTGVWVANGHLVNAGTQGFIPQSPTHEILGGWYMPLAFFIGASLTLLTTLAIRAFLRLSQRVQRSL
ncbi:MAG TPA: DUF1700 domain-containing protein [Acidobacteriaceae bacterium]|jgi:uncharacterized membrane protein|nr:DUF1700 domain-containing protein [Acidobacteriaceae bacterium]